MNNKEVDGADVPREKEKKDKKGKTAAGKDTAEPTIITTPFYNRLFVLTSKGIHLMKNLPAGPGSLKCSSCPNSAFCPAGPSKDEFISFERIQAVINFPQLPQKMVIKYTKDGEVAGKQRQMQLTLNIPTYTKCAKIY